MRKSLSGVRVRVERLAGQVAHLGAGCSLCRGDDALMRFRWRDENGPAEQAVDDLAPHTTCEGCSRTYPLRYVTIGWLEREG